MTLTKQMTTEEVAEHVLLKIKHKLSNAEIPQFKEWLIYRINKVGYFFDYILVLRCFRIWQDLVKGLDHFIVISGREGFGKSTLSFQIAAFINPDGFDLSHICYGAKDYLNVLSKEAEARDNEAV